MRPLRILTLLAAASVALWAQQPPQPSPAPNTGFPPPSPTPPIATNAPRQLRTPATNAPSFGGQLLQRTRRLPTNLNNVAPAATPGAPGVTNVVIPPPNIVIPPPAAVAQPQNVIVDPGAAPVDPAAAAAAEAAAAAAQQDPNALQIPTPLPTPQPGVPTPQPDTAGQLPVPGADTTGVAPPVEGTITRSGGGPNNEPLILHFQQASMEELLDEYSRLSGKVILRPSNLPQVPITLKAEGLTIPELLTAMEATLALNQLTMVPLGDKFIKLVPSVQALQEGTRLTELEAEQLPETEEFVTKIVKLKVAKPSEVQPLFATFTKNPAAITAIDSNNTLILRDYASNVKRMLEILERIDVPAEIDFKLEVIPIKYGRVADIYQTMNALITGATGGTVGGTGAGTLGAGGFGAGGFGGGGFGGGGFGGGGFGGMGRTGMGMGGGMGRMGMGGGGYGLNSGMRGGYGGGTYYPQQSGQPQQEKAFGEGTYYPQQAAVVGGTTGNQSSFQQNLNRLVNRATNPNQIQVLENAHIVPDERSNRLLIFANKRDMDMITNIVAKVDVLLAQVMIEGVVMEVALGDRLNYGVSATQAPKQFGNDFSGFGGYNTGPSLLSGVTNIGGNLPEGFSYWGRIGNELDIAVQAIASDSKANVVSRPRIVTSHAIPGTFFVGETVPYVTGFTDYGGFVGSGVSTRSSIDRVQVGFSLNVIPFITPDGLIVMQIQQDFNTRGQDVVIEGNPIPIINDRSASSILTMRDGDTIMMGGFITDSKVQSKSGVPILKDIPGLGALFRSKSRSNDRTELIVLLRAKILETPEDMAILAEAEKMQLPGVRAAERENSEAHEKRLNEVREQEQKDRAKAARRKR